MNSLFGHGGVKRWKVSASWTQSQSVFQTGDRVAVAKLAQSFGDCRGNQTPTRRSSPTDDTPARKTDLPWSWTKWKQPIFAISDSSGAWSSCSTHSPKLPPRVSRRPTTIGPRWSGPIGSSTPIKSALKKCSRRTSTPLSMESAVHHCWATARQCGQRNID